MKPYGKCQICQITAIRVVNGYVNGLFQMVVLSLLMCVSHWELINIYTSTVLIILTWLGIWVTLLPMLSLMCGTISASIMYLSEHTVTLIYSVRNSHAYTNP